jgi:hypothetical protein
LVFIAREPLLRVVVPMVGLMVVFAAADNVAEVFFAKDVLSAGDTGYGVLVTTWTIGMVMGSTAAGRFLTPAQLAPAVVILPIIGGTAVVVAATGAIYPLAVAMFLVGGFANGVELVGMRSLTAGFPTASAGGRSPSTSGWSRGPRSWPWASAAAWWRRPEPG